jgi:hypothetical protein
MAEWDALTSATVALVAVTGALVFVAFLQFAAFNRSEGRRTQPVAMTHLEEPRDLGGRFGVSLTNEGAGTAFNVRFGVRLDGTEYCAGPERGNRHLVPAGKRVPPTGNLEIRVPIAPYALARRGENVDDRAIFFARYENAFGKTWESRNPADPLADFTIRRSRLLRLHEWRQRQRRKRDERIVNRRLQEEFNVELDLTHLPWKRRLMRRLGR